MHVVVFCSAAFKLSIVCVNTQRRCISWTITSISHESTLKLELLIITIPRAHRIPNKRLTAYTLYSIIPRRGKYLWFYFRNTNLQKRKRKPAVQKQQIRGRSWTKKCIRSFTVGGFPKRLRFSPSSPYYVYHPVSLYKQSISNGRTRKIRHTFLRRMSLFSA